MKFLAITTVFMALAIMLFMLGGWNGNGFLMITMCPGSIFLIWLHGFAFRAAGIRVQFETTASHQGPGSQQPAAKRQRPKTITEQISEFN